jgi:dipeptidyl aminopeptidase/acylaminoacyl peptidase
VSPGLIAAFAWDAPGAPQSVITIDPATGARCRLVSFVENKPIRANVTGLDWSPSGDALAISVEDPQGPDGEYSGQVLLWTPSRLIRIWAGPGQTPGIEWAPDGRSIAVWIKYAVESVNTQVIFADGSPDRSIVVQPAGDGLKWSPDGSRWIVAEATEAFGAETLLSVVDLAAGRVTPIDPGIAHLIPEGWIDNDRVLLYGVQQDGRDAGYLDLPLAAPDRYSIIAMPEAALHPERFVVFSPDRSRAAYMPAGGDLEIAVLAGEPGGTPVRVDTSGAGILGIAWSPDGSQLLFTTFPSGQTSNTTWVVNADGTDLRQIAGANAWTQDDPWQPVPLR